MSITIPIRQTENFRDPYVTAGGETRAGVDFRALRTLWFNTGTLCNLTCANCYIESSPRNDSLVYLSAAEVGEYLDEIGREGMPTEEIGFTGGEPFMNPEFIPMLDDALSRGFRALVLTNAMKPMMKRATELLRLRERHGGQLDLRVSIDHYTEGLHAEERGPRAWGPMIEGMKWLSDNGFRLAAAGRTMWNEGESAMRDGYAELFERENIHIDAHDPERLVLFPEMDEQAEVPEITTGCWDLLGVNPADIMCATSRMVVKRKGAAQPVVLACTLIAYDERFEMGQTLREASRSVRLNHPHCAKFCVLGGGSCSKR